MMLGLENNPAETQRNDDQFKYVYHYNVSTESGSRSVD